MKLDKSMFEFYWPVFSWMTWKIHPTSPSLGFLMWVITSRHTVFLRLNDTVSSLTWKPCSQKVLWCKTKIIIWLPVPQILRHSPQFSAWGTQSHKYRMHRKSRIPASSSLARCRTAILCKYGPKSIQVSEQRQGTRVSNTHSLLLSLWYDSLTRR